MRAIAAVLAALLCLAPAAAPEVIGHRGTAYRPENTLAGISNADYHGADRVELDVRETASGTLVGLHDATLEATTDGTGAVAERSHRYVTGRKAYTRYANRTVSRRYDGRYAVPSLAGIITRANRRGLPLLLDVKSGATNPRLAQQVARATVDVDLQVRDLAALRHVRAATGADVGWCCTWPSDLRALADAGAAHLSVKGSTLTADRIIAAHALGLEVHAWGGSAAKRRSELTGWGVDALHLEWL